MNRSVVLTFMSTLLSVALLTAVPTATAQTSGQSNSLYAKGSKDSFFSIGSYGGIKDDRDTAIHAISYGMGYYLTDGLGIYGEALAIAPRGDVDGLDADSEGIGAFFSLRWHFVRTARWSLFLNHGIGPVYFLDEYPPGGTKLNNLMQYSVGMTTRVGDTTLLQLGIRHIHISNGKGFVDENPAYDGYGAFVGIGQVF